jgi:hypothetical protein
MPNDSRKMMGKMRIENAKKTYLGQRVLRVEIMGGCYSKLMWEQTVLVRGE